MLLPVILVVLFGDNLSFAAVVALTVGWSCMMWQLIDYFSDKQVK